MPKRVSDRLDDLEKVTKEQFKPSAILKEMDDVADRVLDIYEQDAKTRQFNALLDQIFRTIQLQPEVVSLLMKRMKEHMDAAFREGEHTNSTKRFEGMHQFGPSEFDKLFAPIHHNNPYRKDD